MLKMCSKMLTFSIPQPIRCTMDTTSWILRDLTHLFFFFLSKGELSGASFYNFLGVGVGMGCRNFPASCSGSPPASPKDKLGEISPGLLPITAYSSTQKDWDSPSLRQSSHRFEWVGRRRKVDTLRPSHKPEHPEPTSPLPCCNPTINTSSFNYQAI